MTLMPISNFAVVLRVPLIFFVFFFTVRFFFHVACSGVSDEEAIAAVHQALKRGINFIDTSPLYAESERRIGLALSMLPSEELEGLIVSTKVGDECPPYSNNGGHNAMSRDGVLCSVEHSLGLLQRDSVDILLLHRPDLEHREAELHEEHHAPAHEVVEDVDGKLGSIDLGVHCRDSGVQGREAGRG